MQIPSTTGKSPQPPSAGAANAAPAVNSGERPPVEKPAEQIGGYAPSAELVQLTVLAKAAPETRADAIASVRARLAQGYYTSPAAAEQVADALLGAID